MCSGRELHLTGTKEGCGEGECGACSVLVNGELVNSCLTPVLQADGAAITTIEGVAGWTDVNLHAVQQAFIEHGGAQCGICTPGMMLAAVSLLERHPNPTDARDSDRSRRQSVPVHGLHADLRGRGRAAERRARARD